MEVFRKIALFIFIATLVFSVASVALAQEDLSSEGVINIVQNFANWLIIIAEGIIVIFIAYYGIQIATAGGNVDRLTEAKKSLVWLVVGGLVVFGAYIIIGTISNIVYQKF